MASIDIFPLTIGGVQPPLNLLSNIFSTQQAQKNFSYPLDLASNPSFAHAIQFTVFDYQYEGLNQATDGFTQALYQLKSSAGDLLKNTTGSTLLQSLDSVVGLGSSALPFLQAQNYKVTRKGAPKATISLYMPDTVNTTYDSNYQSVSLTDTLGLSGYIAQALGDKNLRNMDWNNLPANFFGSERGKQMAAVLAGTAGEKLLGMNGADLTGVLQKVFGQIPNPQMQLIYKGINMREFQFEFIFTPISAQEAATVQNIIKKFVYYSVPELSMATGGQYLIPPQIFGIQFAYTGGNTVLNAVSNVFRNTMTNVLGSQLSNAFNPSNPSAISNAVNTKLFTIKDCVLTNVNVDYAPNGWAAYSDGSPVQTRLTLQFKEMDIITKGDVDPNQYAIDSGNRNTLNEMQNQVNQISDQIQSIQTNGYNISQSVPGYGIDALSSITNNPY